MCYDMKPTTDQLPKGPGKLPPKSLWLFLDVAS